MAPSLQACKIYYEVKGAEADARAAFKKIKDTVAAIVKNLSKIWYGVVDVADVIGSEMVAAISAAAADIAASVAAAATKAAASMIEMIMSQILKILLSAPTALFALVAIPQQQALAAARAERTKLDGARTNMNIVLAIISKWTRGYGGQRFYDQIAAALPYITSAIDKSKHLISKLENNDSYAGGGRNSFFEESVFNSMKDDIRSAKAILKPESAILERSNIINKLNSGFDKKLTEKRAQINSKYDKERALASAKYSSDVQAAAQNDLGGALEKERAASYWAYKLKDIDRRRSADLAKVEAEIAIDKVKGVGGGANLSFSDLKDGFSHDMDVVGENLKEFAQNMGHAFRNYKICQLACNACFKIQFLISALIEEVIAMLRETGNKAADAVILSLQSTQALLAVARGRLSKVKYAYEQPGVRGPSATQMSLEVTASYTMVASADDLASATITKSLIDLINADETVFKANADFEKFLKRLEDISDWDGKTKIWAVNPSLLVISPYISVIADATALLVQVPTIGFSTAADDRNAIKDSINAVNTKFNTLIRHNSEVMSVLNSYVPYVGAETGNLMRILSNAGLLTAFATTMSVTALIADVIAMTAVISGSDMPTALTCKLAYPDEFPDNDLDKVGSAEAMAKSDMAINANDPSIYQDLYDRGDEYPPLRSKIVKSSFLSEPEEPSTV